MGITIGRLGACVATVLFGFTACNVVTGADDVRFADDDGETTGSNANGAGGSTGAGGQGTGAGIDTSELLPSDVASITGIELYQSVRRPLMQNGGPASSNVPLVAGREALMRIFYTTSMQVNLTVAVTVGQAAPIVLTGSLSGASEIGDLTSTINIPIPAEMLQPGAGYRVELLESPELTSGTNPASVYPAQGQEPLPLESVGGPLKIVLVPISYGADGSNRVPNTSSGQVESYRKLFQSYYPVPDVEITVQNAIQWNSTISANGSGWGELLDAVVDFRQSQSAAFNEHYYGIFDPSSSFDSYCAGGCVTGLSMLADSPNDAWARAGIGVGFAGVSTGTAAHEIGHQHGREHAPCDVGDADPGYPHGGGVIGEWGFDLLRGELVAPSTPDFMGYCDPTWVSDYTFDALFNRLASVNGAASFHFDDAQLDKTYERIRVDEHGATFSDPITLHAPPMGQVTTVTLGHAGGEESVTGRFYPYSHLAGGVLLFERRERVATRAAFDIHGLRRVARRLAAELP